MNNKLFKKLILVLLLVIIFGVFMWLIKTSEPKQEKVSMNDQKVVKKVEKTQEILSEENNFGIGEVILEQEPPVFNSDYEEVEKEGREWLEALEAGEISNDQS